MSDIVSAAASTPIPEPTMSFREALRQAVEKGPDPLTEEPEQDSTPQGQADATVSTPETSEPTDQSTSESTEPEAESKEESKVIYANVTDDKGRRKIKIDLKDEEGIKKAYAMAHGARKWQQERDAAKAELAKATERLGTLDTLNDVYEKQGLRGLVELLDGEGAFDKLIETELGQREWRANATPEELERFEAVQRAERAEKERERLLSQMKEREEALEQKKAEAEEAELSNMLSSSFSKYRFTGKIEDAAKASKLDRMAWSEVMSELSEMAERGDKVTSRTVDKLFKEATDVLRATIKQEAASATKAEVDKRKTQAQQKVAATVQNSTRQAGKLDEFKEEASKGGIRNAYRKLLGF